jgi:hypothetical protein
MAKSKAIQAREVANSACNRYRSVPDNLLKCENDVHTFWFDDEFDCIRFMAGAGNIDIPIISGYQNA